MYLPSGHVEGTNICQRLNFADKAAVTSFLQVHHSFYVDLDGSKFNWLGRSLTSMSGSLVNQECAGTCKSNRAGIVSG